MRFLQPSISKVLLTLILLYPIFILIFFLSSGVNIDCTASQWSNRCGYHPPFIGDELGYGGSVTISLIITYLLTCILVVIYNKFKK